MVGDLEIDLDVDGTGPGRRKLVKALAEFGGYIGANVGSIPNYGERHRCGEAISNAFVEPTVNQVVSKRMVKKQQMRWSQRGAHLLLQIRTRGREASLELALNRGALASPVVRVISEHREGSQRRRCRAALESARSDGDAHDGDA